MTLNNIQYAGLNDRWLVNECLDIVVVLIATDL